MHFEKHNTAFYKKLKETATGMKMASHYAIILMGELEKNILKIVIQNFFYGGDTFR